MKKILLFVFIIYSIVNNQLLAAEQKTLSRYESAIELAEKLAELENNSCTFSRTQLMELEKKCVEYSDELAKLGINVSSLEKDLADVKEDIDYLKSDIADFKKQKDDNVELHGLFYIENWNVAYKNRENMKLHCTTNNAVLSGKAKVDKDIEIFAKWAMVSDYFTGSNYNTSTVLNAEMKLRNAFDTDDLLRIGRGYYFHGSGFVLNGNMDGFNYSKKNGDTNIQFGMYFQEQINNAYHPIVNVYFERNKNKRKYFLDLFYNSFEDGLYYVSYIAGVDKRMVKNCSIWLMNAGLLDQFGRKKEFEYLIDGVVTYYSDDNHRNNKQTGFAGHASIRYTPENSDFGGLIGYNFYTYDCYEELGTRTRLNSWENFANMSFNDKYYDYGHRNLIPNTQDFRLLLSYRPKRNKKHKVEISYDFIKSLNTDKPYGHISEEQAYDGLKVEDHMYGFEYSYNISKGNDFVINYQNQIDKTFDRYYDSESLIFSLISVF